jgi:hypothetical protein
VSKHVAAPSCLSISAILMVDPLPANLPTSTRFVSGEDDIEFVDAHGSVVKPLLFRPTVLSDAEMNDPTEVCLSKPKGTEPLAYSYMDGYVGSAEGQTWDSPSARVQDETQETGGRNDIREREVTFGQCRSMQLPSNTGTS